MDDKQIRQRFFELKKQANELTFSGQSITELGAIKIEAERIAGQIQDVHYGQFCKIEIKQVDTDEFESMYKWKSETDFNSAKFEIIQILEDCFKGHL